MVQQLCPVKSPARQTLYVHQSSYALKRPLSANLLSAWTQMLAPFTQATDLLLQSTEGPRRIVVTGIGKSGIIARKIAATLRSTGTQAHFLHAAEAIHGDLGMLASGDIVLALSYSGETEELVRLLPTLKRLSTPSSPSVAAAPQLSRRRAISSSTPAYRPKPARSTCAHCIHYGHASAG